MFGCESVLNGNNYNVGLGSYDVEVALVEEGKRGFEAECATVEVHEDWKLVLNVFEFWEVHGYADRGGFGDYYVFR